MNHRPSPQPCNFRSGFALRVNSVLPSHASHKAGHHSLQERVDFLEKLLGESADKHSQACVDKRCMRGRRDGDRVSKLRIPTWNDFMEASKSKWLQGQCQMSRVSPLGTGCSGWNSFMEAFRTPDRFAPESTDPRRQPSSELSGLQMGQSS